MTRVLRPLAVALSLGAMIVAGVPAFSEEPGAATPSQRPSEDARRTAARFLPNLGRNLVGVVSRENLKPFILTAGATGLAAPFDDNIVRYFTPDRRAKWLGDLGATIGRAYVIGPAAAVLFGAGRLAGHGRFRDATYDIAQATLVTAAYANAIKYPTHRERPDGSDRLSFPSGHASNAFAWATVAAHHYGWKLGVPSYAFASLMAIARLEKNSHHLTDVLAGAGLGYICGRTVVRRNSEDLPKPAAQVSLAPATAANGQGIGLSLTLAF